MERTLDESAVQRHRLYRVGATESSGKRPNSCCPAYVQVAESEEAEWIFFCLPMEKLVANSASSF